ncbi:MAG: NmrA family transcriptional regulator [Myxococcales bacterium]|nr:NmrA family transcriptional regulator [Myxococcales bacterium]
MTTSSLTMNKQNNKETILVTGATGKTGSRVVKRLRDANAEVRIGSRRATPAFDWSDRATWSNALEGVDAVYICYHPDLAIPSAVEDIAALLDVCRGLGVKRAVLLSGRGEEGAQACERLVQGSGLEWTLIRASWFAQNFSEGFLLDAVKSGVVALPVGAVPEPIIDVNDIAEIAAEALLHPDEHVGQLYEVTGPRLLTFEEVAAEIAAASGREVRYVQCTFEQFRAGLDAAGVPEQTAAFLQWLLSEIFDGRNAHTTDGVERALGRPARDFRDYAREAARGGAWS